MVWMKEWKIPLVYITAILLRQQCCLRTGCGDRMWSFENVGKALYVMLTTSDFHLENRAHLKELKRKSIRLVGRGEGRFVRDQ